jgi:hypothetical protein
MISKDKIFGLFEDKENTSIVGVYEDFMDNPYIKIGMFVKIIRNNIVFFQKLKKYYTSQGIPYNEEVIGNYNDFVIYNRAFFYINQINIENKVHIDALECYNPSHLIQYMNQTLLFFEKREEYEKCAPLFKIIKTLENFLK